MDILNGIARRILLQFKTLVRHRNDRNFSHHKLDGVDAELLFSSQAALVARTFKDGEFGLAVCRAYNDWLSDYCSFAPDRLRGPAIVPVTGIDDATAELLRAAKKPGIRGVHLLAFPSGDSKIAREDDKFWAAAEETNATVTAHHNFGRS